MEDIPELATVRNEASETSAKPELFSEVRKKRKRSKLADMDTDEGTGAGVEEAMSEAPAKRPVFPPVDASTIVVSQMFYRKKMCLFCTSACAGTGTEYMYIIHTCKYIV